MTLEVRSGQPGFLATLRVCAPSRPGLVLDLGKLVSEQGVEVVALDVADVAPGTVTVDITVEAADEALLERCSEALLARGATVRHVSDRAFLYHLGGKLDVVSRTPVRTRQDLSLAYTPGVGRVSKAIASNPDSAWTLTGKGRTVAIMTDGSAVLGYGNLGPLAAMPVMEGKAQLFREFAGLNAFPLCFNALSDDDLVRAAVSLAPGFGGINLEDIAAPRCFDIERRVQAELDIPVFHDDQHGTAAVVLAAIRNGCLISGRELESCRVVLVGCGAAGTAIGQALLESGVSHLTVVDRDGVVSRASAPHQVALLEQSSAPGYATVAQALTGADVLVCASTRGSVDPAYVATMAPQPLVLALANPDPEVLPHEVRTDVLYASGRSDLPNQVNNSLCFPGVFKGALEVRATRITSAMKIAASRAISESVSADERAVGILVPSMFRPDVHQRVAQAVAAAW